MNHLFINKKMFSILLLLILISFSNLTAQNWSFIKPNERYHFKLKGDSIPFNTILIDSIKVEGNNTTNYLNRLFLYCDTCSSEGFYIDNQPGFLQREFILSQVSSTVQLTNPEKYTIHLPDNELKEWWFDEAKTQKAMLESVISENIFGIEDSVAAININGVPQIKIAKNLGLIKYFDYELSGLEKAKLGECLPGWKDFYNFKVGDVFQYFRSYYSFGAVPPQRYYLNKFIITAVEEYSDSIIIDWDNVGMLSFYLEYEWNDYYNDIDFATLKTKTEYAELYTESGRWVITNKSIANTYHDQLLHIKKWYYEDYVLAQYILSGEEVSLVNGKHFSLNKDSIFYTEGTPASINFKFLKDLGKVYYSEDFAGDSFDYEKLIGYIKNGIDTTGVVFDNDYSIVFDMNTNIKQFLNPMIEAYPNPSNGEINFDLGAENKAKIEIYSLEGRLLEQFETKSNQTQNLHQLNSGIYIICIQLNEGLQQLKWIKQ